MREIKFRAWDKVNKRWVYHQLYPNGTFTPPIYQSEFREWQQFTGLHDKNGKEIYEGDIITAITNGKMKPDTLIVEFQKGAFGVSRGEDYWYPLEYFGKYEVIGNIYENHELIK